MRPKPYNPYTGSLRTPSDIKRDPQGLLIMHAQDYLTGRPLLSADTLWNQKFDELIQALNEHWSRRPQPVTEGRDE